jgi:L-fuculose-phosphate aldolase
MLVNEKQARTDLIEVCRLAYQRGYICGVEGNFSIRADENAILSTPSGTCKGRIEPTDLVLTDMQGKLLDRSRAGAQRPSTELAMHLTVYKMRPEICAVAHTHPTVAVGFTVAGVPLNKCVLPEVVCTFGMIPTAPYATPSTDEVSTSIEKYIEQYDAIMLDHHGALTLGGSIWDAFYKMETLEHYAQTLLVAHMLGEPKPLYASQVRKLLEIRGVYGLTKPLPAEILAGPQCSSPDPEVTT